MDQKEKKMGVGKRKISMFAEEINVGDFFSWSRLMASKQAQSSFPTSSRY